MSTTPHTDLDPKRARPGAMTMAMGAFRTRTGDRQQLRIGVIRAGKIVEERLVPFDEDVTIGSSVKNTFVLHGHAMPVCLTLFRWANDHYELKITDGMSGRLGTGGPVRSLESLRPEIGSGAVSDGGTPARVALTEQSRGKIDIGGVTLLFQFVTPPPPTIRAQLPAAVRGGFAKNIDWVFTAFVVFSYMGFFGLVVYLENTDWQLPQQIGVVPASMARLVFDEPEPPLEPRLRPEVLQPSVEESAPDVVDEPEFELPTEDTVADRESSSPNESPSESAEIRLDAAARLAIAEQAREAIQNLVIGGVGEDGSDFDALLNGHPTEGAEAVLARVVGGVEQASRTTSLVERNGPREGSGERTGLGGFNTHGSTMRVEVAQHTERAIHGRVRAERGEELGGQGGFTDEFDNRDVIDGIRRRLGRIRACYERQLINDSSLRGRVSVDFTVTPRGRVSRVSISENTTRNAALGVCIQSAIRGLSFSSGPEGGGVDFSFPFVLAPQ